MKTLPNYATARDKRATMHARVDYWREAAKSDNGRGFDTVGRRRIPVYVCYADRHGGNDEFRDVRAIHECEAWSRRERNDHHTGWYTDPDGVTSRDGSGLCWGIIARLSHGRFLAGYQMGDGDSQVFRLDIHDDEQEACRAADELARIAAEHEQEYQQRWREARDLEDKAETAMQRLRECLALRHRDCMTYVREEARECIATIREARDTLARDYADVL